MLAVMERIGYGVGLKPYHILGMIFIVICTIFVSLSELFQSSNLPKQIIVDKKIPTYVAVLCAFVMPIVCTLFSILIKYADKNLRINAIDWNCAFYFFMSLTFSIIGLVNFTTDNLEFESENFARGCAASIANQLGSIFVISAFNTNGAPFGPITALVNMQSLVVVCVEAIRTMTVPYSMQIAGLILGIIGALILTISDHMHSAWHKVTGCSVTLASL